MEQSCINGSGSSRGNFLKPEVEFFFKGLGKYGGQAVSCPIFYFKKNVGYISLCFFYRKENTV